MKKAHRRLGIFIALALISAAFPAATATAAASQKVTIKLSPASVNRGVTAHLTGAVTPRIPNQLVRLQCFSAGVWHQMKSKKLSGNSTYDFGISFTTANVYRCRVASPHGVSPPVDVPVYGNQWLASVPPVHWSGYFQTSDCGSVRTINSVLYEHPCALESEWNVVDTNWIEWNLLRRCDTFTAVVGLDSTANDLTRVELTITDELDNTLYQHTFGIGEEAHLTLNFSGKLRVKFTTLGMYQDDPNWEYLDLGDPQIHCSWHA